jgi:dTDP-glucose 4,6-dehydratase
MITNVIDGQKIPVYGDGLYVRDWLYVDDHCSAIESVILNGKIGESYNIGGLVKDYSNLEVAKTILKIMGKTESELEFVTDRPGHDRRYAVSWDKIHQELNWSPTLTFEEGITKTVKWYQDNEAWWRAAKVEAEAFYQRLNSQRQK